MPPPRWNAPVPSSISARLPRQHCLHHQPAGNHREQGARVNGKAQTKPNNQITILSPPSPNQPTWEGGEGRGWGKGWAGTCGGRARGTPKFTTRLPGILQCLPVGKEGQMHAWVGGGECKMQGLAQRKGRIQGKGARQRRVWVWGGGSLPTMPWGQGETTTCLPVRGVQCRCVAQQVVTKCKPSRRRHHCHAQPHSVPRHPVCSQMSCHTKCLPSLSA